MRSLSLLEGTEPSYTFAYEDVVAWALLQPFAGQAGAVCDIPLEAGAVLHLQRALRLGGAAWAEDRTYNQDEEGEAPPAYAEPGAPTAAAAVAFLQGMRQRHAHAPAGLLRLALDPHACTQLTPALRTWIEGGRDRRASSSPSLA